MAIGQNQPTKRLQKTTKNRMHTLWKTGENNSSGQVDGFPLAVKTWKTGVHSPSREKFSSSIAEVELA
jgi:hypothetical protein